MSEIPSPASEGGSKIDSCVGICVVLLATFLGVCGVKSGNVAQKMQNELSKANNNWAWFQARNVRQTSFEAAAKIAQDPKVAVELETLAKRQEEKADAQKKAAEEAEAAYTELNKLDDLFDVCEASLAIGLALFGVTALLKQWWLFAFAMVPSAFGVFIGVLGFQGQSGESPIVAWVMSVLG